MTAQAGRKAIKRGVLSEAVRQRVIFITAVQIAICVLAVGCVKVRVQRMDQVVRPPRSPDAIEVLLAEPERPYVVIADIESSCEGALKGFDDLRREMVAKAAALGGDALILGPESKKSGVIFVPTPIYFDKKKLTGKVITFTK